MGQKINPVGLRLGIVRGWDSAWYGGKEELKNLTKKDVQINIFEIKRPELDARLVGESIAQQLEARISYRRAMKQAIASTMRVGAEGIKVKLGGRLAGADMARTEQYKEGRIPLHTLRADIDYAISEAQTVYGKIGIKVWIFKGEVYGKRDLSPNIGMVSNSGGDNKGPAQQGGGDRRRGPGGPPRGERRERSDRDDNRGGARRGGKR
jgi:small subunit ribosomal protein S3